MFNEITEKLKEETRKYTSIIEKQEEKNRFLNLRCSDLERENQSIKDKMKELELSIKKI